MIIRKMHKGDLERGFLETLRNLSVTGDLKLEEWKGIYKEISNNPLYKIFVAEDNGVIIGTTTLLLERKFIHKGGKVGHIEDVAIRKEYQGKGIGKRILLYTLLEAKQFGCYKVILDCSKKNVPFYKKVGFKQKGTCMRHDINQPHLI